MHRVRMLENNWTRGNGIGFSVTRNRDKVYVGNGGSYRAYITNTPIDLNGNVGIIVLPNAQDGDAGAIATHLMNTVEAVAKAAGTAPEKVKWNPAWSRFAGLYLSRRNDSHVVELNEKLVIINPDAPNPDNPIELEPLGDGTFRFVAPMGGGPVGEIVRFVEENGQVVRMVTGDS